MRAHLKVAPANAKTKPLKGLAKPTQDKIVFKKPRPFKKIKNATQPNTDKQKITRIMTAKTQSYSDILTPWTRTPAAQITYTQAGDSCFVGQKSSNFIVQFFVGISVVEKPTCV